MKWHSRTLDFLTVTADAAWLYIIVATVSGLFSLTTPALHLPLAVGVGVTAFASTRWLASLAIPLAVARSLSGALALLTVYVIVALQTNHDIFGFRLGWPFEMFNAPPDARNLVLGTLSALAFWTSGTRLGLTTVAHESLQGVFRTGIAIIISGVVLSIFIQKQGWLYPAIYMFFTAALTGFALARVASVGSPAISGTWARVLVLSMAAVLGGSLILALLTSTVFGHALSFLADMAWLAVQAVAFVVGLGVSYIAEWIINLVIPLIPDNVQEYFKRVEENLNRPPPFRPDPNEPSRVPVWLPVLIQWGSVSGVLGLIGGFIFLLFRGRFRRREREDLGTRRALDQQTSLRSDLTGLLGHLLRRSGRLATYRVPGRDTPLGITYRLYYSMLRLAGQRGLERADYETPLEFRNRAAQVLPAHETALLTDAFSRARYGDIPPSEAEMIELRAAWTRLRAESENATGRAAGDGQEGHLENDAPDAGQKST